MSTRTGSIYAHAPISSGIDWITATAKAGAQSLEFEHIADLELDKARDAGGHIRSASRFGYEGYQLEHFYFGRRREDSMIQVSGPHTNYYARDVITAATGISRLDIQCTVWTHGEQPHLAVDAYHKLCRSSHPSHRRGQVTLITSDPTGETLNVNKRSSDCYGRLYDKASEAKLGSPRTLWRYEVELKRHQARVYAADLVAAPSLPSRARDLVHRWWTAKGVQPSFINDSFPTSEELSITPPITDTLAWFEKSVSITVARCVRAHGLRVTLKALGLSHLAAPIMEGGKPDGRY